VDADAAPDEPKPPADELRVVFVGRAEERKGFPVLLRAFEALAGHVPARLLIVGATEDEVRPFLTDAEVASRVEAVGSLPHDERFWRLLHSADVLCAPSMPRESFGMVLVEGFATGTPAVATEIAGYREVVTDGVDGWLVEAQSVYQLRERLREVLANRGLRLAVGAAARARAEGVGDSARAGGRLAGLLECTRDGRVCEELLAADPYARPVASR
jgi:phosphatidylinositol alpha-mannosyltransferase